MRHCVSSHAGFVVLGVVSVTVASPTHSTFAQELLHDNGPFVTGLADGCNGDDTSTREGDLLGLTAHPDAFHQADDFTVLAGESWTLAQARWYVYQSSAAPDEPLQAAFVRLWSGTPGAGGVVLAGDMATDRLVASSFAGTYRVAAPNLVDCNRALKEVRVDLSWAPELAPGTYWIEFATTGHPALSKPACVLKTPGDPSMDNSRHFDVQSEHWSANVDSSFGNLPCDLPFKLFGTAEGGAFSLDVTGVCPGTVVIAWENALPDRQMGILFARNTGNRSIPDGNPCAGTTLGLGSNQLQLVNQISTRPTGSGSVDAEANAGACGGYLQLVVAAQSPCPTSNVAQIP